MEFGMENSSFHYFPSSYSSHLNHSKLDLYLLNVSILVLFTSISVVIMLRSYHLYMPQLKKVPSTCVCVCLSTSLFLVATRCSSLLYILPSPVQESLISPWSPVSLLEWYSKSRPEVRCAYYYWGVIASRPLSWHQANYMCLWTHVYTYRATQVALVVKNPPANAGDIRDLHSIPVSERGGGHSNPLQYSCLENPIGQRRLTGYSPKVCTESNMTEAT